MTTATPPRAASRPTPGRSQSTPASETTDVVVLPRSTAVSAAIALAFFLVGLGAGYVLTLHLVLPQLAASSAAAPSAPPPPERLEDVSTDDDPGLGPEDAPIVVIEFGDFQCPFCKQFRDRTLDALLAAYPDQIRFVYRDFPLAAHSDALSAAIAAECAGDQDTYWPYHDALYATQPDGFGLDNLLAHADDLHLDGARFAECLDSEAVLDEVNADLADGQAYGVTGTPTFFINGVRLVGAQPLAAFQAIIDRELAP